MKYLDIRDAFFEELYIIMKKDKNVVLILGDQGANNLSKFFKEFPDRTINMGPMEQNIINVAAGLALNKKRVFIHAITPFITLRCFEQISLMLGLHNLPVTIVGSGTGIMYDHEGPTHHAIQDIALMNSIPNMTIYSPSDIDTMTKVMKMVYKIKGPSYIRFDYRGLNKDKIIKRYNYKKGFSVVKQSNSGYAIITTGMLLYEVLDSNVKIIDLYRIKPLNKKLLKELKNVKKLVVLEENIKDGGLTSIISKFISENHLNIKFYNIGFEDFIQDYGKREDLLSKYLK